MVERRFAISAFAILLASVTACSAHSASSPKTVIQTVTAVPTDAVETTSQASQPLSATATPTADDTDMVPTDPDADLTSPVLKWGETAEATRGVRITIPQPKVVRAGEYSDTKPYVLVTVKLENRGSTAVDPTLTTVTLSYGRDGIQADQTFEDATSSFEQQLLPGRTLTGTFGFSVPAGGRGDVVVQLDGGATTVSYAGAVLPLS